MSALWDTVVVGAGPAGATAAYVLAQAGRQVLLVDPVRAEEAKVGESLPGAAWLLLRELNLLSLVQQGSHLPSFGNVSAWGTDKLVPTDFIRDPHGLGWHLNRPQFDAELRAAAQRVGAVMRSARVKGVATVGHGWRVHLSDGQVDARWLVDATGRRARIARRLGAIRTRDDSLVALACWIMAPERDADTRTLVESTPEGWWYTALLPNRTRVVTLHVDPPDAAHILRTPGGWAQRLAQTIHVRRLLAGTVFAEVRQGMEACGSRLDHFVGQNWLATGDAALAFDPISCQGILNSLYTGMKGGHTVHAALSGELDAVAAYSARLEAIRAHYLHHHALVYQAERRWQVHPFWARRRAVWLQHNLAHDVLA